MSPQFNYLCLSRFFCLSVVCGDWCVCCLLCLSYLSVLSSVSCIVHISVPNLSQSPLCLVPEKKEIALCTLKSRENVVLERDERFFFLNLIFYLLIYLFISLLFIYWYSRFYSEPGPPFNCLFHIPYPLSVPSSPGGCPSPTPSPPDL